LFQKHGTFNFKYQFWFLGPTIIIFTKLMLCNVILKLIINFIIYIKRFMSIFIIYIGIIGPQSHFDCINFKASLVIKIINFNEIKKKGPSSYACHFLCGCDFLLNFQFTTHLLHFCSKNSFFEMKIYKLITWYPNMVHICEMTWFNIPPTFIKNKNHLNVFWNILEFLSTHIHYICFHKYIPISHFIKWNQIIYFLIFCLGYNIICKKLVKIFQKFEVVYTQTCTPLESSTMCHPKGGHHSVPSPTSGQVRVFIFKGHNTFVHHIDGLGYWIFFFKYHFFLHVQLCRCICSLRISFSKTIWSIVTNKILNFFIHPLIFYNEKIIFNFSK
jgi:hypothetical protein